ncbi:unnamed protein product [Haemonchus placei]|uniref:Phorbol-ester/DAG-type domain-containing protein n=1 Tax=Haemonchus placei TaxID=6290 RepID=A0A0N4WHM7_HAEPC|nr:unnamed protein product [Haemonchus placei]
MADTRQDDAAYVLGRIWHLKHLFCMICKAPVTVSGCRACPQDGCSPICIDCYMETQHPCCEGTLTKLTLITTTCRSSSRLPHPHSSLGRLRAGFFQDRKAEHYSFAQRHEHYTCTLHVSRILGQVKMEACMYDFCAL